MSALKHPSKPQHQGHRPEVYIDDDPYPLTPPPAFTGPKLKQIQYRSYQHVISIYHFRTSFMSADEFRSLLRRKDHGHIDTLIGKDYILPVQYIPPGDEVPPNRIEVAYVPLVFRSAQAHLADGCALGFRTQKGIIEWVCFERCIKASILNAWTRADATSDVLVSKNVHVDDPRRLFDHVAELDKGTHRRGVVKGVHEEHRKWHASLEDAEIRNIKFTLLYRNRVADMDRYHAEEKRKRKAEERRMWQQQQQWRENRVEARVEPVDDDETMGGEWGREDQENVQDQMDLS